MDILDSHIELLTLRFSFYLDHLGTGGLQDEFWVFLLAPTAFFIFPLFNNFQHPPPRLFSLRTRVSFLSSVYFFESPLPSSFPVLGTWVHS